MLNDALTQAEHAIEETFLVIERSRELGEPEPPWLDLLYHGLSLLLDAVKQQQRMLDALTDQEDK